MFQKTTDEVKKMGMSGSQIKDHMGKGEDVWIQAVKHLECVLENMGPYEFASYWHTNKLDNHWQLLDDMVRERLFTKFCKTKYLLVSLYIFYLKVFE